MQILQEEEKVINGHRQNSKYFYMTAVILKKVSSKTSSDTWILELKKIFQVANNI